MALGGQNEQTTGLFDRVFVRLVGLFDPGPDLIGISLGIGGDGSPTAFCCLPPLR